MNGHGAHRRRFLSGVLGTVTIASLAGCTSGEDDRNDEPEPVVDEADAIEGDTDPEAWRDVEVLRFDGWVGGWVGLEPPAIERVENPTLVLVEGRSYELTWENRDGVHHNFAFWDVDENVVRDYSTDGTDVEGERETLTFEATPEMETYHCEYQPAGQWGEVEILARE